MKVLVKKPGENAIVKEIEKDGVVKAVKKIIKPGVFFGLLFNEVAFTEIPALSSPNGKVVVYHKKKQKLNKDVFNFSLQKSPLINFYGTVVFVRIKDASAEIIDAADLIDEDVRVIEKIAK